jgi:TIR domain
MALAIMAFDAFISHSSKDKAAADAACAVLERAGVRCWIAPRDVMPGGEYGAAIIDAIDQCRVMVLIFSSSANESRQIHREIERAVNKGVPIIPVRIEEVLPTKSMEYFIGALHWLDALSPPLEKHLQRLAETVKAILQVEAAEHPISTDETTHMPSASTALGSAPSVREVAKLAEAARSKSRWRPNWLLTAVLSTACIALLIGGIWLYQQRRPAANKPGTDSSQPAQKQADLLVPETVPFISDRDRIVIRNLYLSAQDHKALAISFTQIGFITGQPSDDGAKMAALASCRKATDAGGRIGQPCELYAVGNSIVYTGGHPPLPPTPWLVRDPSIERAFAAKDIPLLSDSTRAIFAADYDPPGNYSKAVALSPRGANAYYRKQSSSEEAMRRALELCGSGGMPCMIIAVDDSFVVPIPTTMRVTGFFRTSFNSTLGPEMRDDVARRLANAVGGWSAVAVGSGGRAGLSLKAASEGAAIDGALADCSKQDRNCRVIAIGPFSVES